MQLKFEGKGGIDVNTLVEALTAFQSVADTADRACGGKKGIKVKVDPAECSSGIALNLTLEEE